MKKMILGIVWQVLGFLGAIAIVCVAAFHPWNYCGIDGVLGSLLGMKLLLPLILCIALFILGVIFCFKGIKEE